MKYSVLWIRIGFNADPDPGSHTNVDPDPDPGQTLKYQKFKFFYEECTLSRYVNIPTKEKRET
jgi:hypothetical protein